MRGLLIWTCLLVAGLLNSACESDVFEVLEEDADAPLLIRPSEIQEVRRGAEFGLRIRAEVSGYGSGSPMSFIQGRLLEEDGREIPCAYLQPSIQLQAYSDSSAGMAFRDSVVLVETEIVGFSQIAREDGGEMELFFPYHAWRAEEGLHRMQLELEALEGNLAANWAEDVPKAKQGASKAKRTGYVRFAFDVDYPDLHSAQVWVQYLALDTTAFDPHDSDVSLFKINPNYGFPDIFWKVGVEQQEVFRSDYFKNSVSAIWDSPSTPFYLDGRNSALSLCVFDWDDESWFNNEDDALSCWEGDLLSLSQDARKPTRLSFDLVAEMGVVLLLDGADPWTAAPNP